MPAVAGNTLASDMRKRRFLQFGVRAVLILLTLTAAALVVFDWRYVRPYRLQRRAVDAVEKLGGVCNTATIPNPWLPSVYGDDSLARVLSIDAGDCQFSGELLAHILNCPRLETLAVGGAEFSDRHLTKLAALPKLEFLVLDTTSATREAVRRFDKERPSLHVHTSQRRAIFALQRTGARVEKTQIITDFEPFDEDHAELATAVIINGAADTALAPLGRLTHLETLTVMNHRFDRADVETLRWLGALRSLRLERCEFEPEALEAFPALPNLVQFSLIDTPLDTEFARRLNGLRALRSLELEGGAVRDATIGALHDCDRLLRVVVLRASVSPEGVAALKEALPFTNVLQQDAAERPFIWPPGRRPPRTLPPGSLPR